MLKVAGATLPEGWPVLEVGTAAGVLGGADPMVDEIRNGDKYCMTGSTVGERPAPGKNRRRKNNLDDERGRGAAQWYLTLARQKVVQENTRGRM